MFYVPFSFNRNFTGRGDLLAQMERTLHDNRQTGACVPLVLSGLGGMGKTQLMLKYCYTHRTEYEDVFWLEVEGSKMTLDVFRNLAVELGIIRSGGKDSDTDTKLPDLVRRWFQQRTG